MKIKKLVSVFMMGVMLNSSISVNVFADTTELTGKISTEDVVASESAITVSSENVDVLDESISLDFNVTDKWNGGFNGEITINNLTDAVIENWQIEMSFPQEITKIWNAAIVSHNGSVYLIKNSDGNNNVNIPANGCVSFGFSGTYEGEIVAPSNASLVTKQISAESSSYTVVYSLLNDWGSGYTAQLTMTNNTDKPMEAWHITFDFNRKINNMWNAVIENHDGNHYTIVNAEYNSVIPPGESVTFGFNGTDGNLENEPYNYVLIYSGDYIDIYTKDSDVDYEKDTDGDGLPNYLEEYYKTDKSISDTDCDGLSDRDEIYITMTNPLLIDTDNNGITDDKEDFDNDYINNLDEITYRTNPLSYDTDSDFLSDYDEINTYGTNPLKSDTDGDDVEDSDELHIGLNPNNPRTFGGPDAQYKVKQAISIDSKVLSCINTEDNPYELSIDVMAAGYVEGNLLAYETSYSKIIESDSILGIAPELQYMSKENIESVTLNFRIKKDYIEGKSNIFSDEDELTGIKRLNVFKYFEGLNMLLPVETKFDVDRNLVYADVDEFGTYCLIDMNLWLNSFEVPNDAYQQTTLKNLKAYGNTLNNNFTEKNTRVVECSNATNMSLMCYEFVETSNSSKSRNVAKYNNKKVSVTPIDVVFVLQTAGELESTFISEKIMIINLLNQLTEEYGAENVRFSIIIYSLSGAESLKNNGDCWFDNADDIITALDSIEYIYTDDFVDRGKAFQKLQNEILFKENSSKFVFQIMNGCTNVGTMYFDQINTCRLLNINYSEIMPEGYYYIDPNYGQSVNNAILSTNGINVTYDDNATQQKIFEHICENTVAPQLEFKVMLPTGWKEICLKDTLDPNNGIDSDEDTLSDWEETDHEKIKWDADGLIILPTVQDCLNSTKSNYVINSMNRFKDYEDNSSLSLFVQYALDVNRVLPIKSNPCDKDSDGDGLSDNSDPYPLVKYLNDMLNNINVMEKYVDDYFDMEEYNRSKQVIANIIRGIHFNYTSTAWYLTSGETYDDIKKGLSCEYPFVINYFKHIDSGEILFKDPNNEELDFIHMMATFTGQYNSNKDIQDLSGWAADLQTFIWDLKNKTYGQNININQVAYETLVGSNNNFPLVDMRADVDARNIYQLYEFDSRLSYVLEDYYKYRYKVRYDHFVNSYGGISALENRVNEFTRGNGLIKHLKLREFAMRAEKELDNVKRIYSDSFIEYRYDKIYNDNLDEPMIIAVPIYSLPAPHIITENESEALTYAFITFIKENI